MVKSRLTSVPATGLLGDAEIELTRRSTQAAAAAAGRAVRPPRPRAIARVARTATRRRSLPRCVSGAGCVAASVMLLTSPRYDVEPWPAGQAEIDLRERYACVTPVTRGRLGSATPSTAVEDESEADDPMETTVEAAPEQDGHEDVQAAVSVPHLRRPDPAPAQAGPAGEAQTTT